MHWPKEKEQKDNDLRSKLYIQQREPKKNDVNELVRARGVTANDILEIFHILRVDISYRTLHTYVTGVNEIIEVLKQISS